MSNKNYLTVTYKTRTFSGKNITDSICTDNQNLENLEKGISCYSAALGYNKEFTEIISIEPYESEVL